LVIDNSVGCPTEEVYEKWLNAALEKGDEAALEAAVRGGCKLVNSDTAGVLVKTSSHRLSAACVRPKGESECLWISDRRLSVTNPSGGTSARLQASQRARQFQKAMPTAPTALLLRDGVC
jgi:hypothetical protein